MKIRYTYRQLQAIMIKNGQYIGALWALMEAVEKDKGVFPDWMDTAPQWVVDQVLGGI